MTGLLVQFVVLAGVIVVAGTYLAKSADLLGERTGMGRSMAGLVFLAIATSLPELTVDCSAALIPAPDLAIGNILGSNSFNIVILFAVDLFYDGPLLASVSETHAITAVAVIIVTAVATMGMLYRAEKRFWLIEPDAIVVILFVVGALWLVYRVKG